MADTEHAEKEHSAYNPANHLVRVGNGDYLPVAERIRWFREESPNGIIDMEHVEITDKRAIFKAKATRIGDGGIIEGAATGYGSETPQDFPDYIEKASTKALGRALAALGYGTQFIGDEVADGARPRIVDAPVNRPDQPIEFASTRGRVLSDTGNRSGASPLAKPVTPRQLKFLQAIAREKGMSDEEVNGEVERVYGKASVAELTTRDASAFIDRLQSRRPVTELSS